MFGWVKVAFHKAEDFFGNIFTTKTISTVDSVLDTTEKILHDLTVYAIPAAQTIAQYAHIQIPNSILAEIGNIATGLETKIETEKPIVDGILLHLAAMATKQYIASAVQSNGSVKLGDTTLTSVAQIDAISPSLIRTAAQIAYTGQSQVNK